MSLYSKVRKHIDMNRVKELREEEIKEQKIAEVKEQQEEILAELKKIEIKEDPKYYNWRREINEGMTSSGLLLTTLVATGDDVNSEITVNDSSSFSADSGSYILGGGGSFAPFDYTINGNFNGTLSGQSAFTFSAPFNVSGDVTPHRANIESFDQSTNTFTVNDDTITFSAIAGNSSSNGSGLGSNGGTRPTNPLYVTLVVTEDDGSETLVTLGSVPRTTTSLTNFEFKIPQSAFGKQAYLNLYNQQYTTANNWWYGTTLPWHPEGVNDNGVVEDFHMILNHANLNPASGWPSISKTSIALQAWTDMQQAYAGSSWYNDGGPAGYPAPVSGGTRKLGEQDAEGNTIPEAMTMADLEYIVNYIESTFAQYRGMTTTTYGITNLQFKRQLPMNVFVGLDDPDASSFVRDGDFDRLSPADKKKKLEEQLAASAEYLNIMFGDGMPGTATEIADYEPQQSFMDIQAGGERITKQGGKTVTDTTRGIKDGKIDGKPLRSSTPTPKSVSQPDKQPVKGVPFTGLSPEDLKAISDRVGGSYSGTTGKTNPKTTLSNPLKSGVDKATLEKNIEASLKQLEIDNEQLKGDALKRNIGLAADLGLDILTAVTMLTPIPGDEAAAIAVQASKAGVKTGAKTMAQQRTIDAFRTQVTDPKNLSRAQDIISRAPKAFKKDVVIPIKVQGKTINVKANEILRNKGFKVDSYQPQGEVIKEKKSFKDLTKKIPGYYDGKPSPLGFPVEEPPKMKNGMHPDLVDGKKVAQRYNRLDPISGRAMPKTGNPHIDKKVRAAARKPK